MCEIKRLSDEHLDLMLVRLETNPPQNTNEHVLGETLREFIAALKADRVRIEELKAEIDALVSGLGLSLAQLQAQQKPWVERNFGDRPSYWPLLGAVEELGELAHAHLKQEQGIRVSENFDAEAQDAVGDCIVFLCDYCSARGWDIETCVAMAWETAKKRDWKRDPVHGEGDKSDD